MPVRQVPDGGALAKLSRSPLEHPSQPPISPFARHASAGYTSDASSADSPRAPRQTSLFRTKGSQLDHRTASPDGRWPRRRSMAHRPRTSVWLLTLPAFFVLMVVASVVPRDTTESLTAEPVEWHPQRSLGAQAIRSLSESLQLRTANWNPDSEDAVRVFASLFEDMKQPGKQARVEREYGELNPQRLWNLSYAAGPSRWTVGSLDAMCEALAPADARSIAIVGNGPLTEQQRHLIQKADRVMRFNAANNMLAKERVDVWAVRYNDQAPLWYWGFKQLPENELRDVLSTVKAALFLDGPEGRPAQAVQDLLYWFPQIPVSKLLQLDLEEYTKLYVNVFDKFRGGRPRAQAEAMPSSGLVGLLAALACVQPAHQKLDLFGFNWSPKSYYMHKMGSEELMISELVRQFNITVHPPACNALYSCDEECDDKSYRIAMHGSGKSCAAQMAATRVRRELVLERRRDRARAELAQQAGYQQRRPIKKHVRVGRKNNRDRARQLTEGLRRGLEAQGHLQKLVLPQQGHPQDSEGQSQQHSNRGVSLQQQIADQMKAVFDVDW
ncbi:hypothetical protein WJX73_006552 [Symbiochloris irregularis]|uniref:Uncharacterized protein n=1 Tax=Symbiochloris irregularis TaxID=706552 RepID=A0AAW1P8A5_9CHLO